MLYIGADPGKTGGIAAIGNDGEHLASARLRSFYKTDMIDPVALHGWIGQFGAVVTAGIEVAKHTDVPGAFDFGDCFGVLRSAVMLAGHEPVCVPEKEWTLVLCEPPPKQRGMRVAWVVKRARDRWPEATLRSQITDRGVAVALWIAEYLRRRGDIR